MAEPENNLLTVTVVTPDGIVYSHHATMLVMRSVDGELAVMHDHLPLITPLTISEVKVTRDHAMNDRVDHIAVNGGYVEFSNNVATIIADSAERARNIDAARAQLAKQRAEEHIRQAQAQHNDREMLEAEVALRRAMNRLHVRENYSE